MRVYFARTISQYGNKQDIRDMSTLKKLGFTVVDPDSEENENLYKEKGMDVFLNLVSDCDVLVFRRLLNGKIPAGVYKEVEQAMKLNIPIMELPTIFEYDVLTVNDTRNYLQLTGMR